MATKHDKKVGEALCSRWGRCQLDAALKAGGGVALGALASLMLFRLARWPIVFGGGLGLGLAYIDCEQDINLALKELEEDNKEDKQNNQEVVD